MESKTIWLIDHKTTLGEYSPMNPDGSSWILAVCMLSAINQDNALIKFNAFLKGEEMELMEVYEIKNIDPMNLKMIPEALSK
ncbi:MAG: hypothetical protein V4732_04990 [Pseudomonadota bacterium]